MCEFMSVQEKMKENKDKDKEKEKEGRKIDAAVLPPSSKSPS